MPIELHGVSYTYMKGTSFERTALKDVSLTIENGSFTAVAGQTGSGKSTLIQHLNGNLKPETGKVLVDGLNIAEKGKNATEARRKVGIVFQYPEQQLFEETVEEDISFGPKNLGLSADEIGRRVRDAMEFVGLEYDKFSNLSPLSLSGGQRRRAAIAGILAMEPEYLVLDEPTAGLDPRGREELLRRIERLNVKRHTTVVFVSHSMEDIARMADRVIFLADGRVTFDGSPKDAFSSDVKVREAGLNVPSPMALLKRLKEKGLNLEIDAFTAEEAARRIFKALGKGKKIQC